MLEQGYAPSNLPRIVGWSWEARKTVTTVEQQFINELCVSPRPGTRLGGLTLALVKTPFYPENEFHAKEQALVNALWDHRDWVLSTADRASVLHSTEEVLREKYGDPDPNVHFEREPFAGTRFQLEKQFLETATNFDNQKFQVIFPLAYLRMPPEQARDLAQALNSLSRTNRFVAALRDMLLSRAGVALQPTNSVLPTPPPAEEPLLARFVPWRFAFSSENTGRRPHFERLIVRNGRLWSMVAFLSEYEIMAFAHGPRFYVSVDALTGRCEEFEFPAELGTPDESFEVTQDALYVSMQDHVKQYQFATRKWEKLAIPLEGGAKIVALGDLLYLANDSSVIEASPATLATRILGSARRQPPANDLDVLLNSTTYLYARSDGNLGVMGSNRFLAFVPASHEWQAQSQISAAALRGFRIPFFVQDAVLLRTEDFSGKRRLLALWNDQHEMDPLLEEFHPRPGMALPERRDSAPEPTRWDWPSAFDLNAGCFLTKGKALWVLTPRKVWRFMGSGFDEPVKFSDARQATLFYFEPGSRLPVAVPVSFAPSLIEPFDPIRGGFATHQADRRRAGEFPFWLDTPAGLIFSEPTLGGHWLIARDALESRIAMLRAKPRTAQSDSSPSTKAGGLTEKQEPSVQISKP
jgi:hypothetical protein